MTIWNRLTPILFYDIFGAVSVSGKNPKGTGKGELPLLIDKFKRTKEKYNLLIKYLLSLKRK